MYIHVFLGRAHRGSSYTTSRSQTHEGLDKGPGFSVQTCFPRLLTMSVRPILPGPGQVFGGWQKGDKVGHPSVHMCACVSARTRRKHSVLLTVTPAIVASQFGESSLEPEAK